MLEIPSHPDHGKNANRCGEAYPCIICGKAVTSPRPWMVRVWWGTHVVTPEEAVSLSQTEGEGGDTGMYPIGGNCLFNHPEIKPYATRTP